MMAVLVKMWNYTMIISIIDVYNLRTAYNMSIYRIFALSLFITTLFVPASAQEWVSDPNIPASGLLAIKVDALGNQYMVNEEMQVIKYKTDGSIWHIYDNSRLGSIGRLDVSNPFLILVFYPQFQTAVLLDNNMSESGRIRFADIGLGNIRSAAVSDDNNIWGFDEGSRRLMKISANGKILLNGTPYSGFDIDESKPIEIMQRGSFIYLCQPGLPIQIFDIFGKWVRSLMLNDFQAIISLDRIIYYRANDKIYSHNTDLPMLDDQALWDAKGISGICYDARMNCFYGIDSKGKRTKLDLR